MVNEQAFIEVKWETPPDARRAPGWIALTKQHWPDRPIVMREVTYGEWRRA